MPGSAKIPSARIASPGSRPCCLLTPDGPIFDNDSPLDHVYGTDHGDAKGIVYTCHAGFVDLGHTRDLIDLTRYYYDQLKRSGGAKGKKLNSFNYQALLGANIEIRNTIPSTDLVAVAGRLAYLESVLHEIESYWWIAPIGPWPGYHNSAFSPEDLVSNHLGAIVGMQAIRGVEAGTYIDFNDAATKELLVVLGAVGGANCTRARTLQAFDKVELHWFTRGYPKWYLITLYRRNFGVGGDTNQPDPWIVDEVTGCAAPEWPATIPKTWSLALDTYCDIEYSLPVRTAPLMVKAQLGETVSNTVFDGLVNNVRTDARTRYGARFDSPAIP
jgi:hypothetical protein